MQIKWLRKALQNLDEEAEYVARDDPQVAHLIVDRILTSVSLLTENPGLGRSGRIPDTHELIIPKTHYIVPYRVRPRLQQIEILRILHTARRLPESW